MGKIDYVTQLSGSSAPTGAPPTFTPIVTDPVFAAIERHRASHAYANRRGVPDEEHDRLTDVADADLKTLLATAPVSAAGLRAFSEHMQQYVKAGDFQAVEWTLDAIVKATAAMSLDKQAAPSPITDTGYRVLNRPIYRTTSERLADLCAEHLRLVHFYDSTLADDTAPPHVEEGGATPGHHGVRMLKECELLIEALPARSIDDLGLKARVLSWTRADWWDDRKTDEPGARNLVDDVLALAGMDRVRRGDAPFTDYLPNYVGEPHHAADAASAPSRPVPQPAVTEIEKLSREYAACLARQVAFDHASTAGKPFDKAVYKKCQDASFAEIEHALAIEAHVSHLRAATLQDAIFQITLAFGDIESLYSCAEPEKEGRFTLERLREAINRYLYSIKGALERIAKMSGQEISSHLAEAVDYRMPSSRDPFKIAEEGDDLLHRQQVAA